MAAGFSQQDRGPSSVRRVHRPNARWHARHSARFPFRASCSAISA